MPPRAGIRRDLIGQEVKLQLAGTRAEPDEFEVRDRRRDGLLTQAEQLAVESANVVLPTPRVGQRHVLEPAHRERR